jgi:uncharacterized protein (DUF697 family)/tellurite resistance protein
MTPRELEAVAALCVMAALADGAKSEAERNRIQAIFEGLAGDEDARSLASAYRRVVIQQSSVADEARALSSPPARQLAYEMAVAVCNADGAHSPAEKSFLDALRTALGLSASEAAETLREADLVASVPLESTSAARTITLPAAAVVPLGAAAATNLAAGATPPPLPAAAVDTVAKEVDATVLRYAILNGGLELLPQSLATMAIVPLQMKMVYSVGKSYGVSLDRGHIKELIATVGVGMSSQVVENFARNLLGGFAKKYLGKTAGKMVGTATGAAMSFATTYALGMVAKQYYSGGRKLSSVDLRTLFSSEVARAQQLYSTHRPDIERSARETDVGSLLATVRGA